MDKPRRKGDELERLRSPIDVDWLRDVDGYGDISLILEDIV